MNIQIERKHVRFSNPEITGTISENEEKTVKICTFSPYRERRKCKRHSLMFFTGMVTGPQGEVQCRTLVDSGCEEILISTQFAEKLKLRREASNLHAELWDGTLVPMDSVLKTLS